MRHRLRALLPDLYVAVVVAAGFSVVVMLVRGLPAAELGGPNANVFLLFSALLVLGELRPMDWLLRVEGGEITISWSFAFALVLIAPPAGALAMMGIASAFGDALQRKPLQRMLFNSAQVMLSLGAGALVVRRFGLDAQLASEAGPLPASWLPIAGVAGLCVFVANGVFTSIVLALFSGRSVLTMMRSAVTSNLALDGMLLALAPVLVITANRSITLVPLLIATIFAVYRSAHIAMSNKHEATHDNLTDLPNRRLFIDQAAATLARADRREEKFALVLLDLDGFKGINDHLGHAAGDRVLQIVSERLRMSRRPRDFIARLGGDEFAILLRDADAELAQAIVARMRLAISAPIAVEAAHLNAGGSFGIALFPDHGDDVALLLERADIAMYTAKERGQGIEVFSSDRDRLSHSRLSLLADLELAIEQKQMTLHFQPKVCTATGSLVGAEALVRWNHPRLGMVQPDEFIPLVEASDLIHPFTAYVLDVALQQCAAWRDVGLSIPVAVNGSARNLHDARFPQSVAAALSKHRLPAKMLEVEITENMVTKDPARATAVLQRLRDMGVRIAIDDFGTGYSSLANLRLLPIDYIKIDKSFVIAMAGSENDAMIVESIIDLAHNLRLRTVAEGVEDAATASRLGTMGCDEVQGYGISAPVSAPGFCAWFRDWRGFDEPHESLIVEPVLA